jgi:hypothetical protein
VAFGACLDGDVGNYYPVEKAATGGAGQGVAERAPVWMQNLDLYVH